VALEPDPSFIPVSLVTDDGMTFHCAVVWVGRNEHRRWLFVDHDGVDYIGPAFPAGSPVPTFDGLRAIVNEYWTMKRNLGQAGMNARLLRRRLLGLDN
jgi:hypothetical protein